MEKGVKQGKSSYLLLSMKRDQANKMNVERVYRWQPLAWESGPNGSGVNPWLVREWVQCSCVSCTSMLQSWSRVEVEGAEQRQKGSEAARGGWRRGRGAVPWHHPPLILLCLGVASLLHDLGGGERRSEWRRRRGRGHQGAGGEERLSVL